ncbi:CheY-like chemotaxis protein [Methanolinea mesophila]|uniref:response regulator n=1 Tax=Methanolinea mesophila TaxID=547055 RepID=UPI001AE3D334|nr:response regulator [Methanolinea mesophila]MBP1927506.1 CheY-like chemotaxis protein [Methanolinea mesophila]
MFRFQGGGTIAAGHSHKILVVDDNSDLVELYLTILGMKGYTVTGAQSGRECLDELRKSLPDLILLDIMMAPMDGWETLRRIREDPGYEDVPVIMVTGKQFVLEELVQYGDLIDGYIVKPVSPHDLNLLLEHFFAGIGKIDDCAREAGKMGMDPETIREYRFLARRVCAMEEIIPLIRSSYESSGRDLLMQPERKEIFSAILQKISDRKDRLGAIKARIDPC